MLTNKCANVRMEEGYMRITIEYIDSECRSVICDTIGAVERELDLYPEVIHKRQGEASGVFSIEFRGSEEYVCTRAPGEFAELLLQKLEITACNCS